MLRGLPNHAVIATQVIAAMISDADRTDRESRLAGGGAPWSDAGWLRQLDLALAETFLAGRRVDSPTRLGWLLELLEARAVTGRADHFRSCFACFFHNSQMVDLFALR